MTDDVRAVRAEAQRPGTTSCSAPSEALEDSSRREDISRDDSTGMLAACPFLIYPRSRARRAGPEVT